MLASPVLQDFPLDDGTSLRETDRKLVGDQRFVFFAEFQLDLDRPFLIAAHDLVKASSGCERLAHVVDERIMEESEDVEQSRLARSIGTHEYAERREVRKRNLPERAVVLDLDRLNLHDRARSSVK